MKKLSSGGFSSIAIIITVVVLSAVGFAGWRILDKQQTETNQEIAKVSTSDTQEEVSDPTEGGKYFVISEWGIRSPITDNLRGALKYELGEKTPDPDNNLIQSAKIFLAVPENSGIDKDCTELANGTGYVDTGFQLLQTESSKEFNSSRYRSEFKENLLSTAGYNYHANYIEVPICIDGHADTTKLLIEVQQDLMNLESY